VDQFGKKGLSWHGAMVYYICSANHDEGKICYYDHISGGDSSHDWMALLSDSEGIVIQLQKDLPHIKKVSIQTDNAKCYQNGCLIFGLFMLF
jgi:CMP-2-keto-3-deoxyoctulosonic acid synthetase